MKHTLTSQQKAAEIAASLPKVSEVLSSETSTNLPANDRVRAAAMASAVRVEPKEPWWDGIEFGVLLAVGIAAIFCAAILFGGGGN